MNEADIKYVFIQYLMLLEKQRGVPLEEILLEHLYTHPRFIDFYEDYVTVFYPGVKTPIEENLSVELNTTIRIKFPIILRQAVEIVYKCDLDTAEIRDLSRIITRFYREREDGRPQLANVHYYRPNDLGIVGLALWHKGVLTFSEVLERLKKFTGETGLETWLPTQA